MAHSRIVCRRCGFVVRTCRCMDSAKHTTLIDGCARCERRGPADLALRVEDLTRWATARIEECRRDEQAGLHNAVERLTLEQVLRMLGRLEE